MHICLLTLADISSPGGGVHRHIRDLAFGLTASGKAEVHILFPSSTDEKRSIGGIFLHPLKVREARYATPSRLIAYLQLFKRLPPFLNKLNRLHHFDIVHCHHSSLYVSPPHDFAWVNTVHGTNVGEYKTIEAEWRHLQPHDLLWWLYYRGLTLRERGSISEATLNVAVSGVIKEELMRFYDASESSIRIVHNGVDVEALNNPRWKLEDPMPDEIKILSTSSPKLRKGVRYLLRGLAQIPDSTGVHLFLTGIYRRGDIAFAHELGLQDRVTFLGWVPHIEPYYHMADFVVVPSLYEPFPYFCLDALACGKPVIASRVGGLAEVVMDGVDGMLFSPRDSSALAEKIAFLAQNDGERRRMGERGRALVSSNFTIQKMIDGILEVYDSTIR